MANSVLWFVATQSLSDLTNRLGRQMRREFSTKFFMRTPDEDAPLIRSLGYKVPLVASILKKRAVGCGVMVLELQNQVIVLYVEPEPGEWVFIDRKAGEDVSIGLIDFGDFVYSQTVNELAIALAYLMLSARSPIAAAAISVRGFHSQFELTDLELSVLFPLSCMRLCVSLCMSARQSQEAADPYLQVTTEPARRLLEVLSSTPNWKGKVEGILPSERGGPAVEEETPLRQAVELWTSWWTEHAPEYRPEVATAAAQAWLQVY